MDKGKNIAGWGNYPKQKNAVVCTFPNKANNPITIRGNGRSYGDAAIGKKVVSTLNLNKNIHLDGTTETLTVDAGFLLRDVLNYTIPFGYTLATIPGTQFVTIGGMIAADVHGKNHFIHGSIGNWLDGLLIDTGIQKPIWCSKEVNNELFNTTIGGMGLSGIILQAKIKLIPIASSTFKQEVTQANSILKLIQLFNECKDDYQVAWIDLLNKKHNYLFFSGSELNKSNISSFKLKKPKLTIPLLPFKILSKFLMRIYNLVYFKSNRKTKNQAIGFNDFFFPLDKFNYWNRLYGRKGMIQYQFILPHENVNKGFDEIINQIEKSSHSPYLTVLKKYKTNTSPGLLSFPIEGFSLAIDFPMKNGLISFLNELDKVVVKYNGRVYLAKDACLKPESLEKMYPNITKFKLLLSEYKYSSNLANRLNLK